MTLIWPQIIINDTGGKSTSIFSLSRSIAINKIKPLPATLFFTMELTSVDLETQSKNVFLSFWKRSMIKMGDHGEILKWISENSLSFELISYLNSALDLLQHLLETGLVQHLLTVNYRKSLSLRIAYPPDRFFVRINRTVLGLAVTVSIDVGVVSIMFFSENWTKR